MRAKIFRYVALFLVSLFVVGCAAWKPPLQRDEKYPASWQDIASLGPECKALNGTYSNEGLLIDSDGSAQLILLTDILPVGVAGESEFISLKIVTQKIDSNQDTFATLQISVNDDSKAPQEWEKCYCVKHTLFYVAKTESSGIYYIYAIGAQHNVWLTQDMDGALIARIMKYSTGLVTVVPVYWQSHVWARFERIGD
jgi:hypothetical protein